MGQVRYIWLQEMESISPWFRTAKVWKSFKLAYDLKGHEQSVWAVLAVDEEQFLTGVFVSSTLAHPSHASK